MMIRQSLSMSPPTGPKQDVVHAAANLANKDEYGTLILDRSGRILSCGAPAERIFAANQVHLLGRWISEFISGLFLTGSSPSYGARYLVYLCTDGEWRKFEANDAAGQAFTIELNLSRMATDGREIFLLSVRRVGAATCP